MKNIFKKIGLFTLIIAGIFLFNLGLFSGINKTEINECEEMKLQSETLEDFWVVQWQKDMCDSHGYTFAGSENAPVSSVTVKKFEFDVWYISGEDVKWQLDN